MLQKDIDTALEFANLLYKADCKANSGFPRNAPYSIGGLKVRVRFTTITNKDGYKDTIVSGLELYQPETMLGSIQV